VGGRQAGGDAAREHAEARLGERALRGQELGERRPVDQLHQEDALPVDLDEIFDPDDVRVVEPAHQLGLALEAIPRIALRVVEQLSRVDAAALGVLDAEDPAQGPSANFFS